MQGLTKIRDSKKQYGSYMKEISQVPYGPFHRVENPRTQTRAIARLQELSHEVWGRPARGSGLPSVKAYPGILPDRTGIEFDTDVKPRSGCAPNEARWYLELTPGVQLRQENHEDFACIAVTRFRNNQQ
jgi:hypothetical protein